MMEAYTGMGLVFLFLGTYFLVGAVAIKSRGPTILGLKDSKQTVNLYMITSAIFLSLALIGKLLNEFRPL